MKPVEFDQLSFKERKIILVEKGDFISKKVNKKWTYALYAFNGFLVQVTFCSIKQDVIALGRVMDTDPSIVDFFEEVNIDDLFD